MEDLDVKPGTLLYSVKSLRNYGVLALAAAMDPFEHPDEAHWCLDRQDESWLCTRKKEHEGWHIGHSGRGVAAVWQA